MKTAGITLVTLTVFLITLLSFSTVPVASAQQSPPTQAKVVSDVGLPATVFIFANTTATLHCDLTSIGAGVSEVQESTAGFGSGVFLNSNGYILTDGHVVNALTSANPNNDIVVKHDLVSTLTTQVVQYEAQQGVTLDPTQTQTLLMQDCSVTGALTSVTVILGTSQASGIRPNPLPATIIGTPSPFIQRDLAILKVNLQNTPSLLFGESSSVQTGDTIYAMGFTGAVVLNQILNPNQFLEPSFTTGSISAARETSSGNPVFQIDASVSHGNSGGPVLNAQGQVVGLVDFGSVDPTTGREVAGFNFITQSSSAQDYLKENGVANAQSQNDALYRQGLSYYYSGMYGSAMASFQAVLNTYKYNWHAADLISQAQSKINAGSLATPQITVGVAQKEATQGSVVQVTGSISISQQALPSPLTAPSVDWSKTQITLTYTTSGSSSITHTVTPASNGTFSELFTPESSGVWTVAAASAKSGDFVAASGTTALSVSPPPMTWLYAVIGAVAVVVVLSVVFALRRRKRGSQLPPAPAAPAPAI